MTRPINAFHPILTTPADVAAWLDRLAQLGWITHPDDDPRSVVTNATGERLWTDLEADHIEAAYSQAFEVLGGTNFDIYQMCMDACGAVEEAKAFGHSPRALEDSRSMPLTPVQRQDLPISVRGPLPTKPAYIDWDEVAERLTQYGLPTRFECTGGNCYALVAKPKEWPANRNVFIVTDDVLTQDDVRDDLALLWAQIEDDALGSGGITLIDGSEHLETTDVSLDGLVTLIERIVQLAPA